MTALMHIGLVASIWCNLVIGLVVVIVGPISKTRFFVVFTIQHKFFGSATAEPRNLCLLHPAILRACVQ